MAKASAKVVFSLATRNRFWFGMMISVSTAFCRSEMPGLGDLHAPAALEMERLGDHADGENAHFARGAGDDRRGARAGAAAHAGGDEHHMRAGEVIADLLERLLRGRPADLGLGAGAEALGHLKAHLDDALGPRRRQRLRVGVGDDEIDARQAGHDHVVDRVAAGAADAAHHDAGLQFPEFGRLQIDRHACLIGWTPAGADWNACFPFTHAARLRRAPHTRLKNSP